MITRTFKLCLNAGTGSAPYINVSQYDEGETWLFELYSETGERYIPTTGAIVGVKSDGHGIANTGTVDSEGRVVITETQQMTASAGRAIYELSIDGLTHGTANFIVAVERKPTDDAVMSDSDLSLIQEAIDSAEVIVEVIGDSDPSEVIGEHVDAWLDNHPEATTTVEDGAITAPKINQSLWDKLLVSEEASGNPASFDDGADDVPVSSLKVALEPIQTGSGDPSPSNIRPISGHSSVTVERTGKNLLDINNTVQIQNCTFTGTPQDFTLTATGAYCFYQIEISCKANQPVTVRFEGSSTGNFNKVYISHPDSYTNRYTFYSLTETLAEHSFTFTPTEDAFRMTFYVTGTGTTGDMHIKNLQAEYGSEATEYEPFVSNSYPISLGQSVYGGTVDLATGVLTVTHFLYEYNGTEPFNKSGTALNGFYNQLSTNTPHSYWPKTINYNGVPLTNECSSMFVLTKDATTYKNNYGYAVLDSGHNFNCDPVVFGTTVDSFKAKLAELYANGTPVSVFCRIATPQTINLTPQEVKTLLGYNNISSTGTVDVIYHADTKLYVDKMTAVDNAIIAPTEETFTATRNYTTNDLVIVNDTLYKCTANIASGSAITPNSNVTATTLSALIKALS